MAWTKWATSTGCSTSLDATTASDNPAWEIWCSNGTSATTSTDPASQGPWTHWCDSTTTSAPTVSTNEYAYIRWVVKQEETKEQKAARLAREERAKVEAEERQRQEAEAKRRAEELLLSELNEEQKQQLAEFNSFVVKRERKSYRIKRGWAGNIEELDENNKVIARLCVHPAMRVPDADNMLIQKIMLEHAENDLLRTANRTVL